MQTLPTKLYSSKQASEIDRIAQEQSSITGFHLMSRAAEASIKAIQEQYPTAKKLGVVCGSGHNAGDGYLIAAIAIPAGYSVQLVALVCEDKLKNDAAHAKQEFIDVGGALLTDITLLDNSIDVIVDAMLGTGLDREVTGKFAEAITHINNLNVPVLAVDIPSGLHANTGNVMGCAIYATLTVTFIVLKKGLFTGLAQDYCGILKYVDLDIPKSIFQNIPSQERLLTQPKLDKRKASAHKGQFGHVMVVGGDYGYAGAIHLAAEAALNTGAGLVSVATRKEHARQVHLSSPELMGHALENIADIKSLSKKATVLVLGPGLAQREWAQEIWPTLVELDIPRVIDADALSLLAAEPAYSDQWILTPHPGEAASLLKCTTADILEDRYKAIRSIQKKYGGVCVLKGVGSLICAGNEVFVNTTGNPGMASGGMGDVLSGMIGGLLAQKYSLIDAATNGVFFHGQAADNAVNDIGGERGLRASDVLRFIRKVVN